MLNTDEAREIIGATAYSESGDKIGRVGQLFLDDQSGQPEFITVNTGLFGMSESFIPVANASLSGDRVTVPFSKDQVKDAPNVDADGGHLNQDEERRVYEHYNLSYSDSRSDSGLVGGTAGHTDTDTSRTDDDRTDRHDTVGHDTSGPTTDDAMTLSEEQLNVGTQDREAGRARLRKYVDTETVTETVPVRKERAVLEREPITDGNIGDATSGPTISEEEHEVVLNEEVPVVEKTATPVERVRLDKDVEVDQHRVTEEVRKERVELDGDVDDTRR